MSVTDEIAALERDIASTERVGPPVDALIAAAIAKLDEAEAHYNRFGLFSRVGGAPDEQRHFDRIAVIGALVSTNRKALIEAETARVRAAFDAAGGIGMTETERAKRLASLRAELRRALARREIAWRSEDDADSYAARPGIDAEAGGMFLMSDADLKRIASGKEATS